MYLVSDLFFRPIRSSVFWMSISWRQRIYWYMDILRCMDMFLITKILDLAYVQNYMGLHASLAPLCLLIVKTRRATINQHPLPGKDHHHQNSAETQKGEGCIPPSWQARSGGFGTTALRPQQARRTHAQETKNPSFPNVSLWWGGPDNRACSSDM